MTETKYSKYFVTEPKGQVRADDGKLVFDKGILARKEELGAECVIAYQAFTKPWYNYVKKPHKHDFHQLICFLGSNPLDLYEFDAEIELYIGEEQEKHTITRSTIVSIPPFLEHCPLHFVKVDKPFIFLEVMFVGKYSRI